MRAPIQKLIVLLVTALLLTAVCAVCAPVNAPAPEAARPESPAPTDAAVVLVEGKPVQATPAPTETPAPTDSPAPQPSLTTGRTLPGTRAFRPILVMLSNAPRVRPQTGLMGADIVYETLTERDGTDTRLVALYSDEYPYAVGPVTAARVYDSALMREWGCPLVYDGYSAEAAYPDFDDDDVLLSGEHTHDNDDMFFLSNLVSAEEGDMLFCRLAAFVGGVYGDHEAGRTPHFLFQAGISYSFGKPAVTVGVPMGGSDYGKIEFRYQAEDNLYYRYERNSKGLLTASKTRMPNGDGTAYSTVPLAVQNVIVQYVRYTNIEGTNSRTAVLTGSGNCAYFINGQRVMGTWSRETLSQPTSYLLNDGAPVTLEPGTTWIVLHPTGREVKVRAK